MYHIPEMFEILVVIKFVRIILLAIIFIFTLVYSITIVLIGRHPYRFILNVCLTILFVDIYWLIDTIYLQQYVARRVSNKICTTIFYARMVCSCQTSFSLVVISINQVFHMISSENSFFKKHSWGIICILAQLILGFIAPLPLLADKLSVSIDDIRIFEKSSLSLNTIYN